MNPVLALLEQDLRKLPIGQKLNFAHHPYLCKGLKNHLINIFFKQESL
ncbi:hypothetical protein THERMOT_1216 [Bathymodiolus thermophilus thioautotrophic gill symbiont]|uniref:Uncharacterized protein n=1 Tax=Bathymodiolus thermophilus thioautotrophic gill symbiont TaxID=2360 RepID=A0A8H9CHP3_9GAMM|nr:hypothetical protein THERMOT_1216 [Bathymodiolus thermophilus thioautotrophic gill symbiont]CAB5505434.1 hypothetical protein THERMOS_2125 [Bathymodiolus thermophilus thioautotrophic gill symbiont]